MNAKKITTDDKYFREFLNAISMNCLFEHAKANMFSDVIVGIILSHPHLYDDCFSLLGKKITKETRTKEFLEKELMNASEESVLELMCNLFSKKMMIDTLIEYTDEYSREDIIENQNGN